MSASSLAEYGVNRERTRGRAMSESEVVRMLRHAGVSAMECNPPTQTPAVTATSRATGASAPPVCPVADTVTEPMALVPCGRLLEQLDMEAAVSCGWWETDLASMVFAAVT